MNVRCLQPIIADFLAFIFIVGRESRVSAAFQRPVSRGYGIACKICEIPGAQ